MSPPQWHPLAPTTTTEIVDKNFVTLCVYSATQWEMAEYFRGMDEERVTTGKRRNPALTWLVWPLITLGVYYFVWWYKINREARDSGVEVSPGLALLAVLIGGVIIVPPYISIFRTGERIARMQDSANRRPSCNGWIGLILSFFFGLHALYYQIELNRIWEHESEKPSLGKQR